jgi:sRNA-binding regulator protein Hfq
MANFNKSRFGSRPGPPSKKKKSFKKKKSVRRTPKPPPAPKPVNYEETGMEAAYLKALVDAETPVVVVLSSGEELRGIVRYYDRDVFSLGPADGSPKLFLRKESIRYLYEE